MQSLILELTRLYLLEHQLGYEGAGREQAVAISHSWLEQHLLGLKTLLLDLRAPAQAGVGRTIVLDFSAGGAAKGEQQWRALCAVANGLRESLQLPSPAVSISGNGFQLWLSLAEPAPAAALAEFARLLHRAYLPDEKDKGNGVLLTVAELPPARLQGGKWAAFIHPGMGASFADEPALDMAPPVGAQLGFLEGLRSMSGAEFAGALATLRGPSAEPAPADSAAPVNPSSAPSTPSASALPDGLLLKDASLEDIVKVLHARHIEPTFRYLIVKD